ncbi:MAG: hypothetical protein PSX36_14755 [bacterium]|nr:hypothetical protein [bacterium]
MNKIKLLTVLIAMFAITTLATAQTQKQTSKKSQTVYVEIGKMKLKEGVTDEQFVAIEKNIRKGIINKQPGFISREFGKDTEGFWHFRICWTSKEAGDAWTPIFQKDQNGQAMMNALDFSTVRQEHYAVVNP